MDAMWSDFSNPDYRFRGKPFWAWNGKLEADELRRQIRVMKTMGLGGAFMHSRVGLATEYLGEEWFEMIAACIDESRKENLEAWLYDEDRWPSGAAGGLATRDVKYRMKFLTMVVLDPKDYRKTKEEINAFVGKVSEKGYTDLRPLKGPAAKAAKKGEKVFAFRIEVQWPSSWYNGYTYLNTMCKEAVEHFIEITHKAYEKRFKGDFGKVVRGMFTDEPNHGTLTEHSSMDSVIEHKPKFPFTEAVFKTFRERHGYDLRPHLPELFFNLPGQTISRARRDYHDVITHLFVDNFGRLTYEWCERNGIASTGHVLCEESLFSQRYVVGAAMRFYEYMQAPGIDILCDKEPEYITARQCSSVANQMGRPWVLSELYGCTGWEFPFEGHKYVGDWQTALGITLRCQHLSWYTMKGEAKRDYPASIFFQSPWWRDYPVVEDYYARLIATLTRGKVVRDVLVVHPIESAWALMHTFANDETRKLDADLKALTEGLQAQHVDFDFGDEEMMSRLSKVRKTQDGPVLTLAKAKYRAVIVPSSLTLRSSTLDLLETFHQAGGKVHFVGDVPQAVDVAPSDRAQRLADATRTFASAGPALRRALAGSVRTASLTDAKGNEVKSLIYMLRKDGERTILFVCSNDRKKTLGPVTVTLPATGKVEEWDAQTGERFGVAATRADGTLTFTTTFAPTGSRLFVIDPAFKARAPRQTLRTVRTRKLSGAWDIARDEPNVIPLDMPRPNYGDGWETREEILRIDRAIRRRIGVPVRAGEMVQPWAREKKENPPSGPLGLRYTFEVKNLPTGPLALAIETPERFAITLNGQPVTDEPVGWWVDPCLKKIPLAPWRLKTGKNVLELHIEFNEEDDLEACFLLGEFGVKLDGEAVTIVDAPTSLKPGNWCKQGLPFYSAAVRYARRIKVKPEKGEKVFLTLPRHAAAVVKVRVDGEAVGVMPWPPHEVELTPHLTGDNLLEIEVISSRRNAFGPLHWPRNAPWVGPYQFLSAGPEWTYDYLVVPYGLLTAPELSFRRKTK